MSLFVNVVMGSVVVFVWVVKSVGLSMISVVVLSVVLFDMLMSLGLVSGLWNSVCIVVLVVLKLLLISSVSMMCGVWMLSSIVCVCCVVGLLFSVV